MKQMKQAQAKAGLRGLERIHWVAALALAAAAFLVGWFFAPSPAQTALPIRLGGYDFISPLLTCNSIKSFPEDQSLSGRIESVIKDHESKGDVSKASTFFVDLSNGKWSDTFPDEKYYPSSLGKVPIMLAYYELAEANPQVLQKQITYVPGGRDLNLSQDIAPAHAIVPGQTYTVDDLIKYMIIDSDNNATELLTSNIDTNSLRAIYNELQIPVNDDATINNLDFITPQQISVMFRVLYNATFLTREYSEKALQLLSQSSFTQGLVAGLPTSTVVSHKLGLVGLAPNGVTTEHELHDCGIVYAPGHPYLLCVMTRGSGSLPALEGTVSDISKAVYDQVEKISE